MSQTTITATTAHVPGHMPRILRHTIAADLVLLRMFSEALDHGRRITRLELVGREWIIEANDRDGHDRWVIERGSNLPTSISAVVTTLAPFVGKR